MCLLQTHIDKTFYPEAEWKRLEPCERRKVFLNRGDNTPAKRQRTSGRGVPTEVSIASTAASTISSLASSMAGLTENVKDMIEIHNANTREIRKT